MVPGPPQVTDLEAKTRLPGARLEGCTDEKGARESGRKTQTLRLGRHNMVAKTLIKTQELCVASKHN